MCGVGGLEARRSKRRAHRRVERRRQVCMRARAPRAQPTLKPLLAAVAERIVLRVGRGLLRDASPAATTARAQRERARREQQPEQQQRCARQLVDAWRHGAPACSDRGGRTLEGCPASMQSVVAARLAPWRSFLLCDWHTRPFASDLGARCTALLLPHAQMHIETQHRIASPQILCRPSCVCERGAERPSQTCSVSLSRRQTLT